MAPNDKAQRQDNLALPLRTVRRSALLGVKPWLDIASILRRMNHRQDLNRLLIKSIEDKIRKHMQQRSSYPREIFGIGKRVCQDPCECRLQLTYEPATQPFLARLVPNVRIEYV